MSYAPPKDIVEAKIRMLQRQYFEHSCYLIHYSVLHDDFIVENNNYIWMLRDRQDLTDNVQNWLPYKEPEPEFPFQFDDLVCVRVSSSTPWKSARYSHIGRYANFSVVSGAAWDQMTTFSHGVLGKVCEPTTPVWIVREGKPCVKN